MTFSKPPAWLAVGPSPRTSRALGSSITFSDPRRKTLRISAVASEATATAQEPEAARRLYVGNIPRTVDSEELAKMFGEHGSVEKAEVSSLFLFFLCLFLCPKLNAGSLN